MGLLTDPSSGQGKLTKILLKYYGKLCFLLYLSGIIWFASLASPLINAGTYFSENALLSGLVKSLFQEDRLASRYLQELKDETSKHDKTIPYPWLLAKFRQIGLDSYTHNFTLTSPLNGQEVFQGKNVYGILRAPRASSTEALVLSVPYRAPSSIYPSTLPAVAIQLAFAKHAAKEKYWAKDIIFLITDHEQLGMQSWLEAYHGVTCGNEQVLDSGKLRGRAGAIQAAINLELHSAWIGQIDIKIEGLNGQLPNLDLVNVVTKICAKEGVFHTFKGKTPEYHRDPFKEWLYYFKNTMKMVGTQATGIPNGNHGLFLRFGIQALTLEGFDRAKRGSRVGFLSMGRVIEGIFRSMNNLLERFHQSFFFYLLPSYDRYVSIGLYMPAVCAIAAALIIKACAKWCRLQENRRSEKSYIKVTVSFVLLHCFGVFIMTFPDVVKSVSHYFDLAVNTLVFYGIVCSLVLALFTPYLMNDVRKCPESLNLLYIFASLELGATLICLSMNNISLGIFCGAVLVPFALLIDVTTSRLYSFVQKVLWLLVQPLMVIFIVIIISTYSMFGQEDNREILFRAVKALEQSVIYSIVDSMIYGNWLFTVVSAILIPNWLCFWCVACGRVAKRQIIDKKMD